MESDKIDLISKDLEFVKDTVQDTSRRMSSLEDSVSEFHKDFSEHVIIDRELSKEIIYIRKTLDKNTESLIEHMRRTELNELSLDELKNITLKMENRMQPLEHAHIERQTALKLIAKVSAFIGGAIGLASLIYDILSR